MKCAHCQFDVSVGFAFCPGCGQKLRRRAAAAPAVAPDADRRSATVLFADLSGFTAISERLDPEDVRRLQTDLFGALRGVIDRFDAYPEKFIGDAVVAIFGAPVAHEDDPQRALRAALEMHACAAALSERWRDQLGGPLALHIGINTGRVVAGNLGTSADAAYAVTGDAVNTAARLQAAAERGADAGEPGHVPADAARVRVRARRHAGAEGQGRAAAGPSAARRRRPSAGTTCAAWRRMGSRRR